MVEWKNIPWRKLDRHVFKLQKRIYQAEKRGCNRTVHKLQKLLIKSRSTRYLAVRRVSQENQGKKTAGVDGVKSIGPQARVSLAEQLSINQEAAPLRRLYIPKPGTTQKRALGIPTLKDRAKQALAKAALEPQWEARFEKNSYGFRPGRSCQDAIQAVYTMIRAKPKYVLDADIAQCFDRIHHAALLNKLETWPGMRRQIKAWLEAGICEEGFYKPTFQGTPQGGVISPLLANIALHGMESLFDPFPPKKRPLLVRYADDFVVLHEDLAVITESRHLIEAWLQPLGLTLKPEKTRVTHTLISGKEKAGFDFLGFTARQFQTGKHRSIRNSHGKPLGFTPRVSPSQAAIETHSRHLGQLIDTCKAKTQAELIGMLNPVITGWANYYATQVSKQVYSQLDHILFSQLRAWVNRRHPGKPAHWKKRKYWATIGNNRWRFVWTTQEGHVIPLKQHSDTPIVRHIKVKGDRSPYDGDWTYWTTRKQKHPQTPVNVSQLLKKQRGICAECGLFFRQEDLAEVDHIRPKSLGGSDRYDNLQLLHRHCHDRKTAHDTPISADHNGPFDEEPDEGKLSRPVLKTSRVGRPPC